MDSAQQMKEVKRFLKEKVRTDIVAEYDELIDELPDHIKSFREAEQVLRQGTIRIAGKLLQCWIEVAERKLAIPKCPSCKIKMRHRGLRECTLVTTLGEVKYKRPRYVCEKCGKGVYPHDATAKFLAHGVSQSLAQVIARLGSDRPFEQAADDLAEDYYQKLTPQTVRKVTEDAGVRMIEAEDARREAIRAMSVGDRAKALCRIDDQPYDIGVVTCDGAMVHTREKPTYLGANGDEKPDWREVRVGNVSVGNLPDEPKTPPGAKRGNHFRMEVAKTSTFARFESVEDVGYDLYLRAAATGFFAARLRCFISDGAAWIRNIAEEHFPDAVLILDWFHAMERIGELASELFGANTLQARRWIDRREAELWNGDVRAVLAAIRRQREKDGWSKKQRSKIDETLTYLSNNRDRMDYPRYRELGLPIGSGRVEGLCKSLVAARCKLSGMRNWTVRGSEGVLRIRAARRDRDFHNLWRRHFAAP